MINHTDLFAPEAFDPVAKLQTAARKAAGDLSRDAARSLVDMYYRWQHERISMNNQVRAQVQGLDGAEPGESLLVIEHFASQVSTLEKQMVALLGAWAKSRAEGQWALEQVGVGPVIAAGLSAHIDITRAPTVGHIWRFAGLDPTIKWLGKNGAKALLDQVTDEGWYAAFMRDDDDEGDSYALTDEEIAELNEGLEQGKRHELTTDQMLLVSRLTNRKFGNLVRIAKDDDGRITRRSMLAALAKRPWNASLKVLCWKAGDSFVKVSNNPHAFYGVLYRERKLLEVERNNEGLFADQAARTLEEKRITDPATRKIYEAGQLPPGRLDLRARRYAVKLFLAHWHEAAYIDHYGEKPPLPYPIAHLGHAHIIERP